MKLILTLVCSTVLVCLVHSFKYFGGGEWETYKKQHEKVYKNNDVDFARLLTWMENKKEVDKHNLKYERGEVSYQKEINKFSDMTNAELEMYKGLKNEQIDLRSRSMDTLAWNPSAAITDSFDWREHGAVTNVKDQGQCGSCYAFSIVGSVESHVFIKTGQLFSFSEQQIMDCTGYGCDGGWPTKCFEYIRDAGGIEFSSYYPYKGVNDNCQADASHFAATIGGFSHVEASDDALLYAVATNGPVSVAINVVSSSTAYKSGVYDEDSAICDPTQTNHAVIVVGYGNENGKDYWLVRNSWGTSFGENGYIKMARNKNLCGITSYATIPTGVNLKSKLKTPLKQFFLSLNITQIYN